MAAVRRGRRYLPAGTWGDAVAASLASIFERGRMPRLSNPELFNDHILKLKAYGSLLDPLHQFVTDKEYVKYYVASIVGSEYNLETFSILHTDAEVDRLELKRFPCILKPTHLSGPVLICLDPDTPVDRALLKQWLRLDYYRISREANYRFLEPKIIVEEFFSTDGRTPSKDYKIFCFHGRPRLVQVDADRARHHVRNLYDMAWNRLPITIHYPAGSEDDPRPRCLDEMSDVASRLSQPFASMRIDMYTDDRTVKIGELTSCHGGGTEWIQPAAAEFWLGKLFEQQVTEPGLSGLTRVLAEHGMNTRSGLGNPS